MDEDENVAARTVGAQVGPLFVDVRMGLPMSLILTLQCGGEGERAR